MGTEVPNYADAWIQDFAKATGLIASLENKAASFEVGPTSNGKPVPDDMRPQLKTYPLVAPEGKQVIDFNAYALTWSPLTAPYKTGIENDEKPPNYDREHATANAWLKYQLMDDRLVDAVMYSGAYRAVLKQVLRDAICRAVRDDGQTTVPSSSPCKWNEVTAQQASSCRLIFFTHSLGGRMVFDVLTELLDESGSPSHEVLLNGFQIYMFANQLALLELTDHQDPFLRS
jgi:hypothetical protein